VDLRGDDPQTLIFQGDGTVYDPETGRVYGVRGLR